MYIVLFHYHLNLHLLRYNQLVGHKELQGLQYFHNTSHKLRL